MRRASIGVAILGVVAAAALAWQPQTTPAASQPAEPRDQAMQLADMLIRGLESTEGCLGTDAAKFKSGKAVIVAWFKDKAAAVRWYNHPTHKMMMMGMGTKPEDFVPLEHVKDPETPVMVMASISVGGEDAIPGMMGISQIAIEMYTPLPGGAMVRGRLAPKDFPIPEFDVLEVGGGR